MQQNHRRHRVPICRPSRPSQEFLTELAQAYSDARNTLTSLSFVALNLVWRLSDDASSSIIISEQARGLIESELGLGVTTANTALPIAERANAAIDTAMDFHLNRALMSLQDYC